MIMMVVVVLWHPIYTAGWALTRSAARARVCGRAHSVITRKTRARLQARWMHTQIE